MEQLLSLVISVASNLIARAIPEAAMKGIQQAWREHRAAVITSAIGSLLVVIVVALWPFGDDASSPPSPTEQQRQVSEAEQQEQVSPTVKREMLAEALFAGHGDLKQGVTLFPHDHLYGARDLAPRADPENPRCGYEGGHAGWHVRAERVEGGRVKDDLKFHSLTDGTVSKVHTDKAHSTIAVYNDRGDETGYTVLYAHAREVLVAEGNTVEVGDELGVQGRAGLTDPDEAAHVHIEVRKDDPDGRQRSNLACGVRPANGAPGTIEPTEYLYRTWLDEREQ